MSLLDLYVTEVGKHLSARHRADLEVEIRSLLEDAVEDAAQGAPRTPELEAEVLKKFGSPAQVAASYEKPRFLISPRLYPTFWMVLRIVLVVILVVFTIGVGVDLGRSADSGKPVFQAVFEAFAGLISSLVGAFGYVVVIFALIERFVPEKNWMTEDWDPRQLKAEPDPQRVKPVEPILGIVFTLLALLVLNVYPQWIGLFARVDGRWVSAPMMSPAFFAYVPFMNVLLAAGLVRNALLLRQGRWTNALRWFVVAIGLASIALLGAMLSGPALLMFDAASLTRLGWGAPGAQQLVSAEEALTNLFRMVLGIAIAGQLIEIGQQVYRIFTNRGRLNRPVMQ